MTGQAAKNFNEEAEWANSEKVSLAGYMGFAFGEGQQDNPRCYAGNLFNRQLQTAFNRGTSNEWKADCLVYTAHFDLGRKLPSEGAQTQALVSFFERHGVDVLSASVEEQADAEEMGHKIRAISVRVPMRDIGNAKRTIRSIDEHCNGALTKRSKAQAPALFG